MEVETTSILRVVCWWNKQNRNHYKPFIVSSVHENPKYFTSSKYKWNFTSDILKVLAVQQYIYVNGIDPWHSVIFSVPRFCFVWGGEHLLGIIRGMNASHSFVMGRHS